MSGFAKSLWRDDLGQGVAEYAIMLAVAGTMWFRYTPELGFCAPENRALEISV
jgi:hypothetical protein